MKSKNVIVTGGAGFIGSNLVRSLIKDNNYITIIDDLSTGNIDNIQELIDSNSINFVDGSVTDLTLLQKKFKDVDYVFHEAAIPSVPRSVKDPIRTNYANVNGTLNVLVAAKENNVKKVVYASSSSAYGDTPKLPKKEDMKTCPLSPYAISKLTGEHYCNVFNTVFGLSTVCLRYFNVYGPRQDPNGMYAAVIPKFICRILKNEPPTIFGDGEQTRDFTYVKDVVQANILAAENEVTGVFNVANGKRISLNELAKTVMKIIGKNIDPVYDAPQAGDVKHSLADITRAREELSYEPKFNISKGLEETVKWFQKQI